MRRCAHARKAGCVRLPYPVWLPSLVVLSLLLTVPTTSAEAATIRVPDQQPTIQAGINAAIPGDTVLVAPGTYTGAGNKNLNFQGKPIVVRGDGGPEVTIIDCEGQGRGFYFQAGEAHSSVLAGLTVRNGSVSGVFPGNWGGGILCVGSSPTITDCRISNNRTPAWGGGIALYDSLARLRRCTVSENTASENGGGVLCYGGSPSIVGCTISGNILPVWAVEYGAGVLLHSGSSCSVDSCTISGNHNNDGPGGGVSVVENSSLTMTHSLLSGNISGGGAGLYTSPNSTSTLVDCQFVNNTAGGGGGWYVESTSSSATRCTFSENSARFAGAVAVINASPSFTDVVFERNTIYWGDGWLDDVLGGAMYLNSSSPTLTRCAFLENQANCGGQWRCSRIGGGGLWGGDSSPVLRQCVFANNATNGNGGSLRFDDGGSPTIEDCTFYGSRASDQGGCVFSNSATVEISNSIIAFGPYGEAVFCDGGTVSISCTDIYANFEGNWTGCIGSQAGTNGNFSSNPLFCDAENGDFTIRGSSPCAPGNSPAGCDLIGALPVACGIVDAPDSEAPPVDTALRIVQNPVFRVAEFVTASAIGPAIVEVYDAAGREVEVLGPAAATLTWTPGNQIPNGVYFARLRGDASVVVKFVLLR